jgi:hypothetical protein
MIKGFDPLGFMFVLDYCALLNDDEAFFWPRPYEG